MQKVTSKQSVVSSSIVDDIIKILYRNAMQGYSGTSRKLKELRKCFLHLSELLGHIGTSDWLSQRASKVDFVTLNTENCQNDNTQKQKLIFHLEPVIP